MIAGPVGLGEPSILRGKPRTAPRPVEPSCPPSSRTAHVARFSESRAHAGRAWTTIQTGGASIDGAPGPDSPLRRSNWPCSRAQRAVLERQINITDPASASSGLLAQRAPLDDQISSCRWTSRVRGRRSRRASAIPVERVGPNGRFLAQQSSGLRFAARSRPRRSRRDVVRPRHRRGLSRWPSRTRDASGAASRQRRRNPTRSRRGSTVSSKPSRRSPSRWSESPRGSDS